MKRILVILFCINSGLLVGQKINNLEYYLDSIEKCCSKGYCQIYEGNNSGNFIDETLDISNDELITLTNSNTTLIKCLAFQALSERNDSVVFDILMKHLTDKELIITFNGGCFGNYVSIGEFMINQVHLTKLNEVKSKFQLTENQKATLDSTILFNDSINLKYKHRLIFKLPSIETNYSYLKDKAQNSVFYTSIVPLSKYKKNDDLELIKTYLESSIIEKNEYGTKAAEIFPHKSFLPYLLKELKPYFRKQYYSESNYKTQNLFNALVQYESELVYKNFEKIIEKKKLSTRLSFFLMQALKNYPSEFYDLIEFEIRLTEIEWSKIKNSPQ
jgi:hypothetical protein